MTNTTDKSYWKEYSSITDGNKELFINTGNGDWALFVDGEFQSEGTEDTIPLQLKELYEEFNQE